MTTRKKINTLFLLSMFLLPTIAQAGKCELRRLPEEGQEKGRTIWADLTIESKEDCEKRAAQEARRFEAFEVDIKYEGDQVAKVKNGEKVN